MNKCQTRKIIINIDLKAYSPIIKYSTTVQFHICIRVQPSIEPKMFAWILCEMWQLIYINIFSGYASQNPKKKPKRSVADFPFAMYMFNKLKANATKHACISVEEHLLWVCVCVCVLMCIYLCVDVCANTKNTAIEVNK